MPFTYILFSQKLNKYYIGSSLDKDERLKRHNNGTENFTSTGIPWVMVYFEEYTNTIEAKRREFEIKKKKKRGYTRYSINYMIF